MRYRIEVNERQYQLMQDAIQEYARLRMGQYYDLADELARRGIDLSKENENHEELFNRYITKRDSLNSVFRAASEIAYGYDGEWKRGKDVDACIEMYQAMRNYKTLSGNSEECGNVCSCDAPVSLSGEPLIEIERIGGRGNDN